MAKLEKDTLVQLYKENTLSAQQIADRTGVSIDAVYYAMRKYKIPRRNASENSKILFERKPTSFRIKKKLTQREKDLKRAAIMLYWAEGLKTRGSAGIDFANSDVDMQILFITFLRNICGVDEKRIRIYLYCFDNQDTLKLIQFWSKTLSISTSQFTKPYIRTNYQLEKKHKMPYGLVHIRYMDKKLLWQVLDWIAEYKKI